MKVVVVYRSNSEQRRGVEEFIREFSRRYMDQHIEVLDVDSRDGMATVSLYDITSYPAIMSLRDDGSVSMLWQGEQLPLLDEVAGYTLAR
jgi:hypothetical protein